MPIPQWRVMATLSDSSGMSLSELSELTLINQPTVTRLVQRLEAQGFLRKTPDIGALGARLEPFLPRTR